MMGFMDRKAKISLDIFSGRPNPEWEVHGEELEYLFGFVGDISEISSTQTPSKIPQLGYRGFFVEYCDGGDCSDFIHVYDGKAGYEGDGGHYVSDCGLEKWLIEKAGERGYGDVFQEDWKML